MEKKRETTVTDLLEKMTDEMCKDYCKYPDQCRRERKDPADAQELLEKYCDKCPMVRWL